MNKKLGKIGVILFSLLLFSFSVTAEHVLIIGDSHSTGAFGQQLESQLISSGLVVERRADAGSDIQDWIVGRDGAIRVEELLAADTPTYIIIALGTNEYYHSANDITNYARELGVLIPSGSTCFWVGPPEVRENPPATGGITNENIEKVYTAIGEGITGICTLIDSRSYAPKTVFPLTGDGIHLPSEAGRAWARQIVTQLASLDVPVTGTASATRGGASASKFCDPNLYPIAGEAGDPWVYGCSSAPGQGIACKESTKEKNTFTIPIPPDPRAPAYQRLLQACSSRTISTQDPSNKCDTAQFPIHNIAGDPYAYGCVDMTHARSCKKSEGGIFRASFEIPTGTSDQAYQQLAQRCVSGTSAGVTSSSGTSSCTNPQQCREIDEVWQRIGILVRGLADIWDTRSLPFDWRSFNTVYVPPQTLTSTAKPTVSSTTYDELISKAAIDDDVQVPAALLKAIIKHESGFDPWEISATGCVGLFQICTTSAKYPYITKMSGVQIRTGSNDELDNVPSCCTEADCSSYRAACGGKAWCAAAQYRCNPPGNGPLEDDRFDPQRNIMSGALTVKSKMDAIPESWCGIECQVAAYNIGECVIKRAFEKEAGPGGAALWDNVYPHITPEIMDECSERYKRMDLVKKETKIKNLGPYVQGIMNSYNQYRLAGIS